MYKADETVLVTKLHLSVLSHDIQTCKPVRKVEEFFLETKLRLIVLSHDV